MANFRSVPTKRKLDQLEDETQFSSNKKIKAEENSHTKGSIAFSALHREIVHYILSFITNDTQRRHIRSVCQQWFDCINYNEFKIGLLLTSEIEQFSRCFGRYQKPIGLKFMKLSYLDYLNNLDSQWNSNTTLVRSNHFSSLLSSLTQLTALDLRTKNFEVPQELINLQSLTVISPLHQDTLLRLTNLRRLKTDGQLAETPTTLESLDLSNSEQIDISTIDSTYSRLTELIVSTTTRCDIPDALTNLRKLSVFEARTPINRWPRINIMKFPNLEEFITSELEPSPDQYPSTLTKLHILASTTVKITDDLTQLKDLKCYQVELQNNSQMNLLEDCVVQSNGHETILEHLDSQKVTKLQITVTPENINLFTKFTNLINLEISLFRLPVDVLPNLVPLTRLTRLQLIYKNHLQQWMIQLPNLVDLWLQNLISTPEPINFETMQQLTSLVLRGTYESINISSLTNLLQLEIKNESASIPIKIHSLSTATNLTSLSVKQKDFHDSFSGIESSELALLTNLRKLSLSGTELINFADLTTLQHLTFLEVQALSKSAWYLTRLSRLQKVDIVTKEPHEVDERGIRKGIPLCYHFEV